MIEDSAKKIVDKHLETLNKEGFKTSSPEKRKFNFEAAVNLGKESLKLQVFFGKKGIKTILQGNKESDLYKRVNSILFGEDLFPANEVNEPESYIGIDESGKGDYFGPLVIAGVFLDKQVKNHLIKTGTKDSKELSDYKIKNIASEIKNILTAKNYNVVTINPEKYNQLYLKIRNVNKLLAWGHARVLENLLSNVKTTDAISDKFGNENYIISSLMSEGKKVNLIQTHKGERFIGVAAASILAREKFIDWFIKQQKELKLNLPKGASSLTEDAAKNIIKEFGKDFLTKIAKLHFKTTKKVLSE
ncbi:MAG: ribonuclease HIII [Ignavibacteria bacterium]|nr:ribonuclease HIII [Ignavibacteria bacterium]